MPLNNVKVALAVQGGLSPVCATCSKYWAAREKNIPEPRCMSRDGCGGPLAGDDFHEYQGPITDFGRWCFVCGQPSSFGIQVYARPRVIGVCEDHVRLCAELRPIRDGEEVQDPKILIRSKSGTLTIRQLIGPRKKLLAQAIKEVEDHYAKDSD